MTWRGFLAGILILLAGCSERGDTQSGNITILEVWAHGGQAAERRILEQQAARFNAAHPELQLQLSFIPEQTYNAQVQAAAVAGDLPDILEFDGPFLYNYVWQGQLVPLDGLLDEGSRAELLPSIIDQGFYQGSLFAIGTFDSGLGLYARRSLLEAIGARIPSGPQDAWSSEEFEAVLAALAALDTDRRVLDLKLNYTGEWFTYAFSPLLQSAGADLIDRNGYQSAHDTLDGPISVRAMQTLQGWMVKGYVDPNLDDTAFVDGRVALSWAGHWEYSRYAEAFPDDLLVLPLPNLGASSRTGQGSWVWGITRGCSDLPGAASFLQFLLQPEEVLAMSTANGAVPATRSAMDRSALYGVDGPLNLFSRQLLQGYSVPRPKTPAYPIITSAFQQAFLEIRNNGDVGEALGRAAEAIDQDIRDNGGYPAVH